MSCLRITTALPMLLGKGFHFTFLPIPSIFIASSRKLLPGFREVSLLHALPDIPLNVHQVKLMVKPGPGLGNGGGVGQHAHGPLHLSQVPTGNDSGWLVVDADLEASRTPVHQLDGELALDGGDGGVDILGDHVSAEQKAAGHVFSVEGLQSFMKN